MPEIASILRPVRDYLANVVEFTGWVRSNKSRYKFQFDTKVVLENACSKKQS